MSKIEIETKEQQKQREAQQRKAGGLQRFVVKLCVEVEVEIEAASQADAEADAEWISIGRPTVSHERGIVRGFRVGESEVHDVKAGEL